MSRCRRGDLREALASVFALRGDAAEVERLRRVLLGPGVALADELAASLAEERGGLACDALARRLRRRKADVLDALKSDPRFRHSGEGRGSRWRVPLEMGRRGPREQLGLEDGASRASGVAV